jgi:hypothetical protein
MKKNRIYFVGAIFGNWELVKLLYVSGTNKKWLIKNTKTSEEKHIFQSNLPVLIVNEMKVLSRQIKKYWPGFIDHVNSKFKGGNTYGLTAERLLKGKQTQEKTKFFSPIISTLFYDYFSQKGVEIQENTIDGSDLLWLNFDIEQKLSLSHETKSWTGNGYKKVGFHILMKFEIDETKDYIITESFVAMVHLDICKSSWTKPTKSSNFSTLYLRKEDFKKIIVVYGDLESTQKKSEKYLSPILTPF